MAASRWPPPTLTGLVVADDPAAWARAGFAVDDGCVVVGGVTLGLVGQGGPRGVRAWELHGGPEGLGDVDGLPTRPGQPPDGPDRAHPNRAVALDHVVVGTPNRDRTVAALRAQLGLQPRRQTEHELYGRPMVQTFYVLGNAVLELISRPDAAGDGPSVFWGLAFTVDDLDAAAAHLGDRLGTPRDAVQPGRRIATLRGDDLGISVPLALLTPRR